MTNSILFTLWGVLFALCASLGFLPNPQGAARIFLMILAIGQFAPPLILISRRQPHTLRLIRNLALLSLILTVALIIVNFLSISASRLLGNMLYALLVIISSPMVCGQIWFIGLFGWAFLLFSAIRGLRHS